jgi:hypothetical protein
MTGTRRRSTRFALASLVTTTLLVVVVFPSVSAGTESNPEILDAAGDVSPAVFATNKTLDNATVTALYQNVTAYDVVRAWIALETVSDFWMIIKVRDLPDGWGALGAPPEESPFGENLTHAGTSLVANFTINGNVYQAVARLAMPRAGMLLDNYTLWHNGARGEISGTYNTTQDWVAMKLPKEAFAGLADGVRLTNFWVQGRFANLTMDYAPDARDSLGGTPDPLTLLSRVANGSLVRPNYGRDYTFGNYYHPPGSGGGGNWPAIPNIALSASGATQKEIRGGESAEYEMTIANRGTMQDTIFIALNSAHASWSHQLSESQFTLAPGATRTVRLTVFAAEGSSGSMESIVAASSQLGDEDLLSFVTSVLAVAGPTGSPPATQGDHPTGTGEPGRRVPGFEVAFLVGAAALAGLAWRRRRA